ncbi:hypothetical protein N9W34_00075 [Rickettsiales bacterium]|nr:hypothetical protein [Rickettsiales bacterium]
MDDNADEEDTMPDIECYVLNYKPREASYEVNCTIILPEIC